MKNNIIFKKDRIIINNSGQNSNITNKICKTLNNSKLFRLVDVSNNQYEFEKIGKTNDLKFWLNDTESFTINTADTIKITAVQTTSKQASVQNTSARISSGSLNISIGNIANGIIVKNVGSLECRVRMAANDYFVDIENDRKLPVNAKTIYYFKPNYYTTDSYDIGELSGKNLTVMTAETLDVSELPIFSELDKNTQYTISIVSKAAGYIDSEPGTSSLDIEKYSSDIIKKVLFKEQNPIALVKKWLNDSINSSQTVKLTAKQFFSNIIPNCILPTSLPIKSVLEDSVQCIQITQAAYNECISSSYFYNIQKIIGNLADLDELSGLDKKDIERIYIDIFNKLGLKAEYSTVNGVLSLKIYQQNSVIEIATFTQTYPEIWILNKSIEKAETISESIEFISNSKKYKKFNFDGENKQLNYFVDSTSNEIYSNSEWVDYSAYSTLTFLDTPSNELKKWLNTNGTRYNKVVLPNEISSDDSRAIISLGTTCINKDISDGNKEITLSSEPISNLPNKVNIWLDQDNGAFKLTDSGIVSYSEGSYIFSKNYAEILYSSYISSLYQFNTLLLRNAFVNINLNFSNTPESTKNIQLILNGNQIPTAFNLATGQIATESNKTEISTKITPTSSFDFSLLYDSENPSKTFLLTVNYLDKNDRILISKETEININGLTDASVNIDPKLYFYVSEQESKYTSSDSSDETEIPTDSSQKYTFFLNINNTDIEIKGNLYYIVSNVGGIKEIPNASKLYILRDSQMTQSNKNTSFFIEIGTYDKSETKISTSQITNCAFSSSYQQDINQDFIDTSVIFVKIEDSYFQVYLGMDVDIGARYTISNSSIGAISYEKTSTSLIYEEKQEIHSFTKQNNTNYNKELYSEQLLRPLILSSKNNVINNSDTMMPIYLMTSADSEPIKCLTDVREITFTIGTILYKAKYGMTFREWAESSYNTGTYKLIEKNK